MNKREFLRTLGLTSLAIPLYPTLNGFSRSSLTDTSSPADKTDKNDLTDMLSDDEKFWLEIRQDYELNPAFVQLESGYYNMMPKPVMEYQLQQIRSLNLEASYYMRKSMETERKKIREQLADFLECQTEELIITRNTTESMDTVISGYDWKANDEAIMALQDYGAMLDMFRQTARRYGIKNVLIDLPLHPESDEEIVELYKSAITPKTRLIMISHMINISGQILPVKKICDMAHEKGVKVIVDGAHAIGHLVFRIDDLNCDYYAASLHKWLSTPLGAGILWVKKENIKSIWPLFGESAYPDDHILKLNHTGTRPVHVEMCIPAAIDFLHRIGSERKEGRLNFLKEYWTSKLRGMSNIVINTPAGAGRSCAIANVGISTMKPAELSTVLLEKYKIWTVGIDSAGIKGCRITPNVFTTTAELDLFVNAMLELSGNKN